MSLSEGPAGSSLARSSPATAGAPRESANLADILERVLDKGIVIAGDIRVNVLDIELLTIKIRLLVASVDKARELGIDWWEHDPALSSGQRRPGGDREIDRLAGENLALRDRIAELEETAETVPGEARAEDRANEVAE
jgi:Gas vesicle protein